MQTNSLPAASREAFGQKQIPGSNSSRSDPTLTHLQGFALRTLLVAWFVLGGSARAADDLTGPASLRWARTYDGPVENEYVNSRPEGVVAVASDPDGNAIVTGLVQSLAGDGNYYTAKYAASSGAILWSKAYDGPDNSDENAADLAVDSAGNAVVTGTSYGISTAACTVKYSAQTGAQLWQKSSDGVGHGRIYPMSVTVDVRDDILIAGSSFNETSRSSAIHLSKRSGLDGSLIWERRYEAPAGVENEAAAVACDAHGNVIITGVINGSFQGTAQPDVYTAKYAAATGALLWERVYNGPGNGTDIVRGLAVDSSGNAVITADSYADPPGSPPTYIAKYAASNGNLIWAKSIFDYIASPAIDAAGNVFVTGSVAVGIYRDQFISRAAKLDAGSGSLLWEETLGLPSAKFIAVDSSGNAVVTGVSIDGIPALYTAAYQGLDGTLLWDRGYSAAGKAVYVDALALDREGNVFLSGKDLIEAKGWCDLLTIKIQTGVPEISVEFPVGTELVDGAGTIGFGATPVGESVVRTVTVRNLGTANLKGILPTITGTGSAAYSITAAPPGTVEPGASATFTLRFAPGAETSFVAALRLANNDANENPFDITLSGTGTALVETPLTLWRQSHFGTPADGGAAANDADPDRDGIINCLEFVCGSNPSVANAFPQSVLPDDSSHFIYQFTRADVSEFPAVTLTVEAGSDLVTWPASHVIGPDTGSSSPGVTIEENGSDPDTVSVRISHTGTAATLARLKVVTAP